MGGLLVKQALITSKLNPRHECIRRSTYGLMFFATPHRGGNWAGLADFAANICGSVSGSPKNSLLQQLKGKSLLNEIALDQFSHQTSDYEIISYYETKMTKVKIKGRRVMPKAVSMVIFPKVTFKDNAEIM
ncbi:uncharacterized protein KY384_001189 [Bacidia gigantensis]|uniref:uncharacterized protein n=1 Tax=Bacidia gigantensis TaxID=2732470 RepID=UPI001D0398A6|nr:uncharacterized protein KY384_001189 [Bacidia gigantensis]KAG8534345.1 hypothetical protein KY384_001189 [Bacidia gigantensis]